MKKEQSPASFWTVMLKTCRSFSAMTPLILGVIGLVGILQTLVSPSLLAKLFRGNPFIDTFAATAAGSVAAGNPVVSYIIGGELLEQGVSLYAVTAFLLSWVTLGFAHLPMELEVLGSRFTIQRNILAFIFAMVISVVTTLILGILE